MTAAPPRLACFDLDNTLIDREGAFLAWARWWAAREGLGAEGAEWLLAHDEGGFRARGELFAGVKERFGMDAEVSAMVDAYDREHPSFVSVEPSALDGLASLRTAGWRVAVITNGGVVQQSRKLVGDHPAYDIAGGIAAGLSTVLVGNHHSAAATVERSPTHHFAGVLEAFPVILAS